MESLFKQILANPLLNHLTARCLADFLENIHLRWSYCKIGYHLIFEAKSHKYRYFVRLGSLTNHWHRTLNIIRKHTDRGRGHYFRVTSWGRPATRSTDFNSFNCPPSCLFQELLQNFYNFYNYKGNCNWVFLSFEHLSVEVLLCGVA